MQWSFFHRDECVGRVYFPGKTMKDQISDPLSLRGVAHQWWVDAVQCRESLKGFYCSGAQSSLVWVFVRK